MQDAQGSGELERLLAEHGGGHRPVSCSTSHPAMTSPAGKPSSLRPATAPTPYACAAASTPSTRPPARKPACTTPPASPVVCCASPAAIGAPGCGSLAAGPYRLKARRRGAGWEGCPGRREPSHIGVRCSQARCCRYGTGVLGCSPRTIGSSPAARVIMVHVDELPLLKRLVTHATGVLLCFQKLVEQLLGQPVARNPVLPVGLLAGFRRLAMWVVAVVQPVALHGLGCLARASMPRSAVTCRLLSRHPLAAPLLPHSGKVYLRLFGFTL